MDFQPTEAYARRLDAANPLARFRDEFYVPPERIYLDGNSLGLLSRPAERTLRRVTGEWRQLGIDGWTEASPPWYFLAERLAEQMAPLVGAAPGEVIVTGSTTGNLHQLLATLWRPERGRTRVVVDELNFPSDLYALASQLRLRGIDPDEALVRVGSRDGRTLDEDDLVRAMDDPQVGLAVLPSVVYTSGQLLDLERVTRAARVRGVLLGWDCSHSVGAVPHHFADWDCDFAFWCTYKYLNGGPGSVGALYLNRRHWGHAPGLAGWWGSDKQRQFDMAPEFARAEGAGGLQIGTPHLLSMAPLHGALELFGQAGIEAVRTRSLALTTYLMQMADARLAELDFGIATPREPERRGGHVALTHPEAVRIAAALKRMGVVPDFRAPDIVRLAPVALYNTFAECFRAVELLRTVVTRRAYERLGTERGLVA